MKLKELIFKVSQPLNIGQPTTKKPQLTSKKKEMKKV
jgi:hypothetical protein